MNWAMLIYAILTLCALLLTGFIVYVLIQFSRTLKGVNMLLEDLQKTVPSMLEKLDKTIASVSSEAQRVDEIMKSVEEIGEKVTATAEIAKEIISSPLIKIASLSAGAKKAINTLLGRE
jgi:uncharacterized protein YoxC